MWLLVLMMAVPPDYKAVEQRYVFKTEEQCTQARDYAVFKVQQSGVILIGKCVKRDSPR